MTDIIELLKADHKEVRALLQQLTADEMPEDCDALFDQLHASVTIHSDFEEQEVYPLLKAKAETKDLALEAYEEHRQVKTLLDELDGMDDDDEACAAKMQVLSEDLNHHIKEEESRLLPQVEKAASRAVRERLGAAYQEIKDAAAAAAGGDAAEAEEAGKARKAPPTSHKGASSR